jgi:MFS family permease
MVSNEKKIIVLTSYCHFLSHFYMLIFPALVIPLTKYFEMPIPEVLSLGFLMYLLFGLGALPMGFVTDLWNGRRMLTLYLLGLGAFSLLAGVSRQPTFLMVSLTFIGFFASIYHPAGMGLISKGCRRRGYALGINGVFGNLGLGLAPIVTGIVTYWFGWRTIYVVLGALVFISSIVLFFVHIDETPVQTEASKAEGKKRRYLLYFAVLCVCMMLAGFCFRGTSVVIPAYFEQAIPFLNNSLNRLSFIKLSGAKTLAATALTSIVYLFGMLGQMTGGRLADKLDLRLGYFSFHLIALPFMVLMTQFTDIPLFAFTMTYAFFALGMQPIENSLVASLTPERLRSTSYGFKFIFTFGVGSVSVFTAKLLIKHYSFVHVFWLQAGVIVMLLATIGLLMFLTRHETLRN